MDQDPDFPNPSRAALLPGPAPGAVGGRPPCPPTPLPGGTEGGRVPSELPGIDPGESSSWAPALAAGPGLRALVWEHFNVF